MFNKKLISFLIAPVIVIFLILTAFTNIKVKDYKSVTKDLDIFPEYNNKIIPPNIAPLNFHINQTGDAYFVKIHSKNGDEINIGSKSPSIIIPIKKWKKLLNENKSEKIIYEVYVRNNKKWTKYNEISNTIANEEINPFLVYRLMHPAYSTWTEMELCQRNIENFQEKTIIHNKTLKNNCVNCHTFRKNDPDKMLFHTRHVGDGPSTGMIIADNGKLTKINTKTDFNKHTGYAAWHPNGKIQAFSLNNVTQFFHSAGKSIDVIDIGSDIIIYDVEENVISSADFLSDPDMMETYPTWSPEGDYLYYCNAPMLGSSEDKTSFDYKNNLYSLYRVFYDTLTGEWGNPETIISSDEIGKTIILPRVSPDGKYLLFCIADYGNLMAFQKSDIYIMDLQTGEYNIMKGNSSESDSFHTWSSNSRWFVFSSKHYDGICTRPFFSYVDKDGVIHEPFVLPQKKPEFYKSFNRIYNLPELLTSEIKIKPQDLDKISYSKDVIKAKLDPKLQKIADEKKAKQKN